MESIKEEIDSLVAKTSLSDGVDRRGFLKTALGTGFAASVLPVSAQTISTDSAGLTTGEKIIEVKGAKVPVYVAQPAGKKFLEKSDALAQASAQIGQEVSQKAADELKQRLIEALRQKGHKL